MGNSRGGASSYAVLVATFVLAQHIAAQVVASAGIVAVPVANMFALPDEDSAVVSQAIYGFSLEILDERPGWLKIRTPDDYRGWVTETSLSRTVVRSIPDRSSRTAHVSSLSANVYREPDITAHKPLLTLPYESQLQILPAQAGDEKEWLRVRLVDGREAWVQIGDLDSALRPFSIAESIALARRFLGTTYTWAGTSSFGFDCSGFTQMLVRSRGIIMPRDADQQAAWAGARPVERKKLKSGDLLFFGESSAHITHTGMFIGHGRFIHDTPRGHPGVQISRLRDRPWTQLLVACRRPK